MVLTKNVTTIIKALNQNGYEAYVVGGCVRDFLLGHTPKDWDITTNATPPEIKKIFSHTVDTGIKHGTVTVVLHHENYEVTTYRIDGEYVNFRQPETVFFTDDVVGDLGRRDFTMNAIAYHPEIGFVDPFDGVTDIKNKTIRGVFDPPTRFNEDALRMMRAVRFSAQLDFGIDTPTYEAIQTNAHLIQNISVERIRDEFLKLLLSHHPEKLTLLVDTGLLTYCLPELKETIEEDRMRLALASAPRELVVRLCILLRKVGADPAGSLLKHLRLDNKTIKDVVSILKQLDKPLPTSPYEVKVRLYEMGEEYFLTLLALQEVYGKILHDDDCVCQIAVIRQQYEGIQERTECYTLKKLSVNGNDIQKLGLPPMATGQTLERLLHVVMEDNEKNEKEILLKMLSVSEDIKE